MTAFKRAGFILLFAAIFLLSGWASGRPPGEKLRSINLPPGFRIEIYALDVPGARSMVLSDSGTLFVGSREQGKVYAVIDRDTDHKADEVISVASDLNSPNGVALRDGDLYVAEISRVIRFEDVEDSLSGSPAYEIVNDSFPADRWHGWKYIAFGPDGKLYVPVGAPCNVCDREDERYASIMRMEPGGGGPEIYARGVRNTVGFDWHPQTGVLWFTDNGRDRMGDNIPPDELNRAPRPGLHFGFPYCHGADVPDPKFGGPEHACGDDTPPARELGPHVAALGMRFYTGDMFPEEYRGQIFVAEHGSWNRSVPIGYRVMLVRLKGHEAVSYEVFADGWLQGSSAWGRPVDVVQMKDGSLLVSDDRQGAVYRVSYGE